MTGDSTSDGQPPVEAVLFDLDDTLVTYRRSPGEVLELAFDDTGYDRFFSVEAYYERFEDYLQQTETLDDLRRACFADLAAEAGRDPTDGVAVAAAFDDIRDPTNVETLPGARRVLDDLAADHRLGVVTNGSPSSQEPKLAGAGIADAFETVVFAGVDTAAKPDPEPFERALASLGVAAERAVMIGDSLDSDVTGAHAAGLRSVFFGPAESHHSGEVVPDYHVEELSHLLDRPWADA